MKHSPESASEHKLALAADLLDDIELSRLSAENLLLKASRLARIIKDDGTRAWLHYELSGFPGDDPISIEFMGLTGRWTDRAKGLGYWQSLAEIDAQIAAWKLQIQQLNVPNVHFAPSSANPHESVTGLGGSNIAQAAAPVHSVLNHLNALQQYVTTFSGIRSRVLALLHRFATRTYYELAFSNIQESIFERQKSRIDARLAASCGSVLEKVPAVYDRLTEGSEEAISQALNTCRRILDSFADSIYPPSDETVKIGDNELKLSSSHHQNRINAYVHAHCCSQSREQRLRSMLSGLYDRISTGVHKDVSAEEARFLFLQAYLLMGEVTSLEAAQRKSASN